MSRYIDADAFVKAIDENGSYSIDDMPSIDIVRCGECKYNEDTCINHGEMNPRCRYANYKRSADDFCSYGERSKK